MPNLMSYVKILDSTTLQSIRLKADLIVNIISRERDAIAFVYEINSKLYQVIESRFF